MSAKPRFFASPVAFRAWLKANHKKAAELIVGYHKKHTGKPSLTWPESVAEALCYGWIDGIRRSLDEDRYTIRFTPRRPRSQWSAVNIRMVAELEAAGRMTAAGRAVFNARPDPESTGYTHQKREAELDVASIKVFKKNKAAWAFFDAQPPSYRKKMAWWVVAAKQAETRERRLKKLILSSSAGKRLM
jgi:uncharacterized protein YdeI (YjbR/CyaY-like superfamily)